MIWEGVTIAELLAAGIGTGMCLRFVCEGLHWMLAEWSGFFRGMSRF